MGERRGHRRQKSFLHGFVYFDKRRGVMSYLVRDLSDDGARIVFSQSITLPEKVNLHIPQRDKTFRAKVKWRRGDEMGASALAAEAVAATSQESELIQRVAQLESEIVSLKRTIKQPKREAVGESEIEAA